MTKEENRGKRIIVAVTGASGAVYARLLMESLFRLPADQLAEIALVISANGWAVADYEKVSIPGNQADGRVKRFENTDMFAAPASGSAGYDAMVVIPCSMGTVGRIASGTSGDLISRAADVMLKERRQLILVTRETPFSTIHLRNMAALSECGAVVMPASPSFYSHPEDIAALCMTVVERVVSMLGFDVAHYSWGE